MKKRNLFAKKGKKYNAFVIGLESCIDQINYFEDLNPNVISDYERIGRILDTIQKGVVLIADNSQYIDMLSRQEALMALDILKLANCVLDKNIVESLETQSMYR